MLASLVNMAAILAGGAIGLLFKRWIKEKYTQAILKVIGLITLVIGMTYAIKSENILVVIVCLVLGTLIGELLKIDDGLEKLSERAARATGGSDVQQFSQGFVASTLLFGVGSMAIMGSMRAGIEGDYTILYTKSLMDGVTAVTFAAGMGPGVLLSAVVILIYQGGLTLLFKLASTSLDVRAICEMSAVGGVILLSIGANMAGFARDRFKSANMLPALVLPFIWFLFAEIL